MTILSPFELAESSVALLPADAARRIRRLDDYSMRNLPGDKVGFAKIEEFKGLENEAIIVVDLPAPDATDRKNGPALRSHEPGTFRTVVDLPKSVLNARL